MTEETHAQPSTLTSQSRGREFNAFSNVYCIHKQSHCVLLLFQIQHISKFMSPVYFHIILNSL